MPAGSREPGHRVHQHREEGHHHDDGRLRLPVEAEPHHHDGRDADHRQGRDQVAERQEAAAQERHPVDEERHEQPGPAAHGPAGQHGAQEGLDEVRREHGGAAGQRLADRRGRRAAARRHAEADDDGLPQEQQPGAEQHRHQHGRRADARARRAIASHARRPGLPPAPRARAAPPRMDHPEDDEAADGNQRREQQAFDGVPAHGGACRRASRWARPTRATSTPESSEAATRAAQICTVWP